ncbi:spermatogenesis-associated protein 4-like isoform X2 [Haliotis rufescens]|uniref:spermatogenesis-associated protein 4-like isoform X2 n=1 Tax=Haliotis rufescens TaxID=6454 RepID=UPI001EB049FD|nr:spermatogenesis-associated protein 4-like isoform X2 [Haliotis rufescens]
MEKCNAVYVRERTHIHNTSLLVALIMSGLSREVLRWIQSLDLTWQMKTPKWDLTNGYLVAEIFSWYFPQEIQMHSYYNGTSLDPKQKNWSLLKNFIKRQHLEIPEDYIEGTIHCKEGAANLLTERMYEILTNRKVKKVPSEVEVDFTDKAYQSKLPMHARSTASKSIKNNLRITEIMADQDLILGAQKSQKIINDHIDHRRVERFEDPQRFNVKPTIGEKSLRRPPPPLKEKSDASQALEDTECMPAREHTDTSNFQSMPREPSVHFKEVQVNQVDKSAFYNMPIQGY